MSPLSPDDEEQAQQAADERKLLGKLRLRSFTASPSSLQPFQTTTLAWSVDVPASVANELDVTFTIGEKPVSNPGTLPIAVLATGGFDLIAHSPNSSRRLGTAVVTVNLGELHEGSLARSSIEVVARQAQGQMEGGSTSARKDLEIEMLPSDGIRLKLFLRTEVENFFDANIDATLDFKLSVATKAGGRRAMVASLVNVDDDISFDIIDHILSIGTATAAQAILQPMLAELIQGFVGPRIEALLAAGLQTGVDEIFKLWKNADRAKRDFRLFAVETSANGVVFFGNPVTPQAPPLPPVIVKTRARRHKR